MSQKKVSPAWQILATFFLPTAFYAFKRIGKLRYGILIYAGTYALWAWAYMKMITTYRIYSFNADLIGYTIITIIAIVLSIILPMWYINKWTNEYNKKIEGVKAIS